MNMSIELPDELKSGFELEQIVKMEFSDLSKDHQTAITQLAAVQTWIDTAKSHIQAGRVDLSALLSSWLDRQRSDHTRTLYKTAWSHYSAFLSHSGLDPLLVEPADIQNWITSATKTGANANSIRTRFGAVSSFYAWLEMNGKVSRNPCKGVRTPKRVYKYGREGKVSVLTSQELEVIISQAEQQKNAERILPMIRIMAKYGVRLGGLQGLKVTAVNIAVQSKGQTYYIDRENDCDLAEGVYFKGETANRIKSAIDKLSKKIVRLKLLNRSFSAHDFRHYAALTKYISSNYNIVAVSRMLGHSSIAVTDAYLQGLLLAMEPAKSDR